MNHAASVLLGKSRDELIGGTDHDILPAEQADRIRDMDQHVVKSGQDVSFEEEISLRMEQQVPL
nr:PAS domain-containing protein [Phyllobacterium bourgognense]